jgi:hypothetical protein
MSDGIGRENGMARGGVSAPPAMDSIIGEVVDRTRQAGTQAVDLATDLTQDIKARGKSMLDDTTGHIASAAKEQKDGLADQMDDVAKAVHRSGEQLEGQHAWIAGMIERGADELGSLASQLRSNDLSGLLANLQDLARRQPAIFVGASMAAGFAMVRVGKIAVSGMSDPTSPAAPEVGHERE